jgi:type II secretory pathway component PulM
LTQREKQFVIGGVAFLGLLVAFQLLVKPAIHRVRTLKRAVTAEQKTLKELRDKSKEYNVFQSQLERIRQTFQQQEGDRQMLSLIERIQKDCGLLQKVVYMTPTTMAISDIYEKTSIEVKFKGVTLDQIIQFLLKIESSKLLVGVKSLEINSGLQNSAELDAIIQVASLSAIQKN